MLPQHHQRHFFDAFALGVDVEIDFGWHAVMQFLEQGIAEGVVLHGNGFDLAWIGMHELVQFPQTSFSQSLAELLANVGQLFALHSAAFP